MLRRESDATYFMRRAEEEARLALKTTEPAAAAAHRALSVRYAALLRQAVELDFAPERSTSPESPHPKADLVLPEVLRGRIAERAIRSEAEQSSVLQDRSDR